jgi:Xaa-Pro aminopeptidase
VIDFKSLKIDALLVSSLPNVRYLTGYTGSNGMALLTPDTLTLFTDPRYAIRAREEVKRAKMPARVRITTKTLWEAAAKHIPRKRLKRTGFEQAHVTYGVYKTMDEELPLGYSLIPVGCVIEELRLVKTGDEIERIRCSVITNSRTFEDVAKRIKPGISEAALAADLDFRMRKLGAEGPAFPTIVAAGIRTALVHASPTRETLKPNDLLLIDMGSAQDGYMSDMTRMLFLGKPDSKIRAMYRAVLEAQLAAVAAVREGVGTWHVDRAAREVLKAAGFGKQFVHSTGHGLGLEIHEAPRVGRKDRTRLQAGMVITIEPGAYVEGFGGMRVEDTVLVTKNGCEVLTPTSKELMVL